MGKRARRFHGCRVGLRGGRNCARPNKGKATLVCDHGHTVTIWLCEQHLKTVKRRYLVCKPCSKMGRDDVKSRELPLVADLPLRFRTLDAQFDSE